MVTLRVVVALALFVLGAYAIGGATFNDMTSPDPTFSAITTNWGQTGACWTQAAPTGAQFAAATAACQSQTFGSVATLSYATAKNSVSSGTPTTTAYTCFKVTQSANVPSAQLFTVGTATGGTTTDITVAAGTGAGTSVIGAQFTLATGAIKPAISLNSPAANAAIVTTLTEFRIHAVLSQVTAFTSPTYVAGGTKTSVGGYQFDGGQTPVTDSISPAAFATGTYSGSTTVTPITYGFAPNANWAAADDGKTFTITFTDSAIYKPPATPGACTAGAQTLTSNTVQVNVVMVTGITGANADLFVKDSVLVEKFGGTGSYLVTTTTSTDSTTCTWTDTTPTTKNGSGGSFTTNTVTGNGGTLTVTCAGTGTGSSVKYTAGPYPVKVVQMGTISVPSGGAYATGKIITGTGVNPTIQITQASDTNQITFSTTSAGTFGTNPATVAPYNTLVNFLSAVDDGKTITATAQYKGASNTVSAIVDTSVLTIVYISISTFTDTTPNSQQSGATCPTGYNSPCVIASATSPTVSFNTVGTGFDTQGISVNGALTPGGTGTPTGSTQSITFNVAQDKTTIFSRVANSAASTFTIDSNGVGSNANNKQYTLAFITVSAGTAGFQVTSPNTNAGKTCVMSPATTTCTFKAGGTAFNTVDIVETGGTNLGQTGISTGPGLPFPGKSGVAGDDGSTVVIKAYIAGVPTTSYSETSAQSINIYYLSVTQFQTQVTPAAVPSGATNYVYFAANANQLGLKTIGTGFDTVVYGGFNGGGTVTDATGTFSGSAPNRVATVGPKAYTVVLADDNKQITLTISNSQGAPATTYSVPSVSFSITLVYTQVTAGTGTGTGIFATGAGASDTASFVNAKACIATVAAPTCTYTVTGNSFNSYTYTASNAGTTVIGSLNGPAAPAIGPGISVSFTTPALTVAEDGATFTATVFESGSSGYTTRPTSTTSPSSLFYLSVSSFETNTVPTSFNNAGKNYVVINSVTALQLDTKGTGFNTVSYTATSGTLNTTPQGKTAGNTAGTETAWMSGASPSRTADSGQLTITGLSPADNNAVVSTTVSNKAVSSTVTYKPANALNIVYLSQTTYSVTAPPPTTGGTCYATPSAQCTFTLTGTGFDTFDYASSAAGSTATATNQAASVVGSPAVSTATWTPTLTYKDTTANAATPVTMGYTAYYKAQPATRLTITGSLPLIFISDIEFGTGNKFTPLTNSKATPNTLNLFAAGDNTVTSPNPILSGKGTGFTNAKLQAKPFGAGSFTDVPGSYGPCTVTNGGTSTATYSCSMIPTTQTGFNPTDDQTQFQVVLWNSGNVAVTYTTAAITVTVFGFKVDPPTSLIGFTTVRANVPYSPPTNNFVSYTYQLVNANGLNNNIPATQTWSTFNGDPRDPQMPATTTPLAPNAVITFLVSANAAKSSTPTTPWAAGGPFVGKNADSYKITLTLSGVSTLRQTSFQLITFSYFSLAAPAQPNLNGDYLYDYYLGYTGPKSSPNYVPPNPEPGYAITVKSDHLAPLDKTGAIIAGYSNQCTLTVTPGTAGLVGPTLTQTSNNIDSIQFVVDCSAVTDPSQPNCVYNQVELLNQATLQVACTGATVYNTGPYGPSVPLTIKYPAKMGLAPTQAWTSNPTGFCSGYAGQYPEPGHWDYDQALTINFNWAKLGNPQVTGIQSVMTWDIRTVSSSGTALNIGASGGFPGAPKVLNGANPIAYQISNGTPLTIAQARDIYFNNFLTVTGKFDGTGGTPLLSPFTITFQPLDVSKDNGILQPHFPPVLATTPVLLAPQFNNFPDVGGFVWQPPALGFVVKDGFPKHDSPFGNTKYSTAAIPVFPNRNYDQILETRVTVAFSQQFAATSPTTYDNKYQYFTSVAANLVNFPTTTSFAEPKAGTVTGAYTNGIVGVYAATSAITPTGPLWTYNKWIYRWILGVYKVSGQYEPYTPPTAGVFDPTLLTYKYHTASSGFEGVWNWYPREFTPSSCPSVPAGNPFDIGTVNAVVVPSTTASMYPTPDAGVLSWAYSHQTAGPSFRIDSTLASGILSGAQNSNTALLPAVSTVVHTFNSQYTITKQQASPTADAFGPQSTEDLGYTVTATGKISSIVSADANSIITARYSHTLPFYLLLAPDGKSTTSGQRTVVGYPTVVTVNNCKSITTLTSNTAYTVSSHRAGETFVLSLSVTGTGTFVVTVVDATPGTLDTPQQVISTTVNAGTSPVFRFTAGYNLAGVPLTTSTITYTGAATATVKLSYHEFSSIPANWPFANDPAGAAITGYANNEAVKTCVTQKVSASSVSGTTFGVPTTAQYFGCGTANQVTSPSC